MESVCPHIHTYMHRRIAIRNASNFRTCQPLRTFPLMHFKNKFNNNNNNM